MRWLYTLLFYLAVPLILARLWWRSRAAPAYARRWRERFGFFPPLVTGKKVVWIHTVSVGEFLAALPLIRSLLQQPELQLVVTTTTPTGSERVTAALGDNVFHVYAPYDLPDCLARFLNRVQPELFIIMETELWPNTLAACAAREIPSLLINARLSARSARGYGRFAAITRPMLGNLTCAGIQGTEDAARFEALGLQPDKVVITGNLKFDLTLGEDIRAAAAALKQTWSRSGQRLVWIAASTHEGEDEQLLDAFASVRASSLPQAGTLLLVLVPRHPERFDRVAGLCAARGWQVSRRSRNDAVASADIVLGDTMGELLLMYGASDLAFVGGSLVERGGHNLIEPAAWKLPVLSGPHLFNFSEVARLLDEAGALTRITSPDELASALEHLVGDAGARNAAGDVAWRLAEANRGALAKTLALVDRYL